jgi:hypothetical protein
MSKRAFERRDGVLVDRRLRSDGREHTSTIAATMLGEEIAPELRAVLLERVASGDGRLADDAVYALSRDATPEMLDALVLGVERGGSRAACAIVPFGEDARVRPAILRALETAPPDSVPNLNLVQAIGRLRLHEAQGVLEKRLAALEADARIFDPAPPFHGLEQDLQAIARAMLQVDPGHVRAARALTRLCEHPARRAPAAICTHATVCLASPVCECGIVSRTAT